MAFDLLAPTYDQIFTETHIGRWLRGRVHARLNQHFRPGTHILELGCGTGEDARHLAAQGVHVTATDASPGMLEMARSKNAQTPLASFVQMSLSDLPENELTEPFDGAFSNFGALNCIGDWKPLAVWLAQRIPVGHKVGFGIMSPYCVWEVLWHGVHLDFRTATRRLRKSTPFKLADSSQIDIYYPTPRRITRDFAPYFKRTYIEGLGIMLPTSDAYGVVEKRARLLRVMQGMDSYISRVKALAVLADHYWIEFERVTTTP